MADFTGHTPGLSDALRDELSETGMDLSTLIKYMDMDNRPLLWLEATALCNAAPSLLARAEAAEERVRVLEGAVAELVDSLHTCESCDGTGKYQDVACDVCGGYGECVSFGAAIEAAVRLRAARAALATTGVQHG